MKGGLSSSDEGTMEAWERFDAVWGSMVMKERLEGKVSYEIFELDRFSLLKDMRQSFNRVLRRFRLIRGKRLLVFEFWPLYSETSIMGVYDALQAQLFIERHGIGAGWVVNELKAMFSDIQVLESRAFDDPEPRGSTLKKIERLFSGDVAEALRSQKVVDYRVPLE